MIRRWIPLWVLPLVVLVAAGTIWLRLKIVSMTYEVDQTQKMIRNALQDVERLELDVARLRSPRRLEALARMRFGLVPPRSNQVIHLKDGG